MDNTVTITRDEWQNHIQNAQAILTPVIGIALLQMGASVSGETVEAFVSQIGAAGSIELRIDDQRVGRIVIE